MGQNIPAADDAHHAVSRVHHGNAPELARLQQAYGRIEGAAFMQAHYLHGGHLAYLPVQVCVRLLAPYLCRHCTVQL